MHEYADRLDHGRAGAVWELFTEDGTWSSPTVHSTGHADLQRYFLQRADMVDRVTHHVVTNITITVENPDRATGRSIAIEYRSDNPTGAVRTETSPAIIGDYHDTFVRTADGWRFKERRVLVDFQRAGETFIVQERGQPNKDS